MSTTVTSTTLSAVVDASQKTFNVAAATGITGPGANNSTQTLLFVDQELMEVVSITGTTVTVVRGVGPTRAAAHLSGATIWVGPPAAFQEQDPPIGQVVGSTVAYLPWISIATGNLFTVMGLTTAGRWVQVNRPGVGYVGSDVASATTIVPTGTFFIVSGTTAVATITVPAGFQPGMQLFINPSGIFATTTAGNIGLVTSATVVGRILIMTWDGTKFWPSYVS